MYYQLKKAGLLKTIDENIGIEFVNIDLTMLDSPESSLNSSFTSAIDQTDPTTENYRTTNEFTVSVDVSNDNTIDKVRKDFQLRRGETTNTEEKSVSRDLSKDNFFDRSRQVSRGTSINDVCESMIASTVSDPNNI